MDALSPRSGHEWHGVGAAARLAAVLESATDNVILVNPDWRIAFINKRARHCFGDDREGLVGTPFWDFWPRRESGPSRQMLIRSLEQQSSREFEDFFPELDSWFAIHADPWEGGLALHLRDVTERRYAADELAASESRYRAIVESAADAIVVIDDQGIVDEFNGSAEAMFGYPSRDIVGRHISLLVPGLREVWHDDEAARCCGARLLEGRRSDGTALPLSLSLAVCQRDNRQFLTAILRGSDGREALPAFDDRLRHTSKLELLGTLAGGISHDFNNLLLVMTNMAELALDEVAPDSPVQEHLDTMRQAIWRAEGLVHQILAFCRQDMPHRERLCLGDCVAAALDLLRASVPKTIAIRCRRDDDRAEILADQTQLYQVILNLGINAAAAIGNRRGTIAVELATPQLAAADAPSGLAAGGYARLTVRDDGAGMEPGVLARAFEPFFTTRPAGMGTGLGLAVVQGIVAAHGGAVIADSEPGIGTSVAVYLPLASGRGD